MRGERPFVYHTPNGREMFQALQKILPALRTGAVNRSVGDAVLQWSAAEQMPLGYAVPSARRCRAARPPLGGGLSAQPTGGEENRMTALPPSALRAATSLAEGGKGRTDCRVASLLAMTALRAVEDAVLQWSAAEQMPLGYDVPSVGADDSVRPRLARPVGRGPRAPPERMCLLRRDTWTPPYKSFRRGRCPHRPARIALPANALGVRRPTKKASPGMYRGMRCVMGDCLTQ